MLNFLLALFTVFLGIISTCGNGLPEVRNIQLVERSKTTLMLTYDLLDVESDSVSVSVLIYDGHDIPVAGGRFKAFGDIGPKTPCGKSRRVSIHFPPEIQVVGVRLMACDWNDELLQLVLNDVDTVNLRAFLNGASGLRHFRDADNELPAVRSYIEQHFLKCGMTTRRQQVPYGQYTGENIVGVRQGTKNGKILLAGAHLDAVEGSTGADDNATGIAALMEISRVLSRHRLDFSLGLVAFDLEEEGCQGSRRFLSDRILPEEIIGYINFDMIGYTDKGSYSQPVPEGFENTFPQAFEELKRNDFTADFVLNFSTGTEDSLRRLFNNVSQRFVPELNLVSLFVKDKGDFAPELFRASDHASFWDNGIEALSVSDTGDVRNPNYHSSFDTIDTVDIYFLSRVVKVALGTILKICKVDRCVSHDILIDK